MGKPNKTCSIRCNLNNFIKNVATNEKYILRKMDLKFQSNISKFTQNSILLHFVTATGLEPRTT